MTDRFYSADDVYFSKQMLLGRHDHSITEYTADELVHRDLMPAFQEYVKLHTKCVQQAPVSGHVQAYHQLYDTYSAARDPAHHLLARIFGQEWADEYVYDVLFPGVQKRE
jgi:Ferredoxin-dependent bilin reductase